MAARESAVGRREKKTTRSFFSLFSRPPTLALLHFRAPPKKRTPDRKLPAELSSFKVLELFEKMYHGKLQGLVWDAMLVSRLRGTNMAAGNRQKHLEFTLAISKPFFSLLNFHTLT